LTNEAISKRIARELGIPDLAEILADKLPGSDLHSLLLAVIKRRVAKIEPPDLAHANSLSKTCDLDGRLLNRLEGITYETAIEFEAIELSPLIPSGAVTVLTGLDQANVLSTVRAFECASDPTIGLALECARRRKNPTQKKQIMRMCTNQRVVRFPLPTNPGFTAHFKLFSLVSAGRDTGSFSFEVAALQEHIGCYLSLVRNLTPAGFAFEDIVVEVSDTRVIAHLCSMFEIDRDAIRANVRARDSGSSAKVLEQCPTVWPKNMTNPAEDLAQYNLPKHMIAQLSMLEQEVCAPLRARHNNVRFEFNMHRLTGLGYYVGPCFHIKMKNVLGQIFMLADGGFVDWTQLLLSDGKERLMTSAIGTELLCRMFHRQ